MWEDEANARGGKLVLRLKKGLASHFWEEVVSVLQRDQVEAAAPEKPLILRYPLPAPCL
jgi:translation initiation factor 4E